jgi:uncharacterized protein (DUF305 family)
MKKNYLAALVLIAVSTPALAQTDHQQQHPGETTAPQAQAQPQAPAPTQPQGQIPMMGQMMQNMPEQCRAMMQNMPQDCMAMMQGGPGQGSQSRQAGPQSEATKAYMAAMDKMHGPMTQGIQDPDPDVAFVKGMIPHHQSAIDMAKVVLQHGKDEQAKKWATDVIREQEREIAEMREWLRKRGS